MRQDRFTPHEREYQSREDKTIVKTTQTEELGSEQVIQRYNNAVRQVEQMIDSIQNFRQKIADTQDEYNTEMGVIHVLDEDESQELGELDLESVDEFENCLSKQDFQRFFSLQQMSNKKDEALQNLGQLQQDIQDLYRHARKAADRVDGLDLEKKPEDVDAMIEDELFPGDEE